MTASSLVKYAARQRSNGRALHWNRVDIDGLPYRGDQPPLLREDEYQERVVRVADAKNGFFDVSVPEQNERYLEVLDAAANGWYQIVCLTRFINQTMQHYVEWVEYYLEDGKTRTPYLTQSILELSRGQSALPGDAGNNS